MNLFKKMALAVALIAALSIAGFSQSATTQTVLSSAVTSSSGNTTTISVASASGDCAASVQGQEYDAFVDGEFMKIQSINTTANTLTVTRGYRNTAQTLHASGSIVFCGKAGQLGPFIVEGQAPGRAYSNVQPNSVCTSTQYTVLPLVSIKDGRLFNCLATPGAAPGYGRWIAYGLNQWSQGHNYTTIDDAAYTATLADEFINFVALSTGRTVTLPAITGVVGKTIVIMNSADNGSTITISPSASQGVGTLTGTSTTMSGRGAATRLISTVSRSGAYTWNTW